MSVDDFVKGVLESMCQSDPCTIQETVFVLCVLTCFVIAIPLGLTILLINFVMPQA